MVTYRGNHIAYSTLTRFISFIPARNKKMYTLYAALAFRTRDVRTEFFIIIYTYPSVFVQVIMKHIIVFPSSVYRRSSLFVAVQHVIIIYPGARLYVIILYIFLL